MKETIKKCLWVLVSCLLLYPVPASYAIEPVCEGVGLSSFLAEEIVVSSANQAALDAGYDFSKLELEETKATLVFDESDSTYKWIVCYIVQGEAVPYLTTVIEAKNGNVLDLSKANYFEIIKQWEEDKQLNYEYWDVESLVLFDKIYRRSVFYPRYVIPFETDIEIEKAVEIAKHTLQERFGLTESELSKYTCTAQLMQDYDGKRLWYVTYSECISLHQVKVYYQMTFDSVNGDIVLCIDNENSGYGNSGATIFI